MTPVARIYEQQLLNSGVIDQNKLAQMKSVINGILEDSYTKSKSLEYKAEDWMTEEW
jgi:2-oxoglutarate dehydrogenase complex dehydrogenase (E1) component-like enzyme